jgi:hypothetical protein
VYPLDKEGLLTLIKFNINNTMFKDSGLCILTMTLLSVALFAQEGAQMGSVATRVLPFYVYREFHSRDNHFAPSGWMGDYGDVRFDDHFRLDGSKSGKTVIRVSYSAQAQQGAGWAGMYWQNPANNWGNRPGGFNLNGARRLVFKARGEKGGEIVEEFKVGGISGDYADSGTADSGPITLSKNWKEFSINLDGQELSSITGGFCWTINRDHNPDGAIFYLDNIRYE